MAQGPDVKRAVLLIATFDTKAEEALYLRAALEERGCGVLTLDAGVHAAPSGRADVKRAEVAWAGGMRVEEVEALGDKNACIGVMTAGARKLARALHDDGRIQAVIGIGGAQGTAIGTAAMRELPFGVPKFMVSTVASGRATFGPFVDTKDVILMHSVADIQGLNAITRRVLDNAAAAVCGMVLMQRPAPPGSARPAVAVSMLGTTTPGALRAKGILEANGFEFVAFHQNGTGGIAMEDMIAEGLFRGVLDLNLHEIGDGVYGGLHGAIRGYRLETAGRLGLPQVVAPGSINYTVQGPYDSLPPELKRRKLIVHNPYLTLVRLSADELRETARVVARKLNGARGPVHVFVPLRGFSYPDREGQPHWDPEGNEAFVETLRGALGRSVAYDEIDAHINDDAFIDVATGEFLHLMNGRRA